MKDLKTIDFELSVLPIYTHWYAATVALRKKLEKDGIDYFPANYTLQEFAYTIVDGSAGKMPVYMDWAWKFKLPVPKKTQ